MSSAYIIENMPEAEYHARPEVSKHDLDLIHRAPWAYRYAKDNPEEETEEMNFGSLVHLAVLEPERLESHVCFVPDDMPKDLRRFRNAKAPSAETLESCDAWDDFTSRNEGKKVIKPKQFEALKGIQKSLLSNTITARLLEADGPTELSVFWERFGVQCRARIDKITDYILDLKTCGDATRQGFMKEIGKRRYAHQGEHYLDGAKANGYTPKGFVMIAVETEAPYLCTAHRLGSESIALAMIENRRGIEAWKRANESGYWPGIRAAIDHEQKLVPLEAPAWAFE